MRRFNLSVLLVGLVCSFSLFAKDQPPVLNVVHFPLTVERWATTKTAKVLVSVNAVVSGSGLDQIHASIQKKLSKLSSKALWHITTFQRSKDSSGLERVFAMAETRLPDNALSHLRRAAKSVSRPGETYKIVDIQFVPSEEEIQTVTGTLRHQIYRDALNELQQLNKLYTGQHFILHRIRFSPRPGPRPVNMLVATKTVRAESAGAMAVSRKVLVRGDVELASIAN